LFRLHEEKKLAISALSQTLPERFLLEVMPLSPHALELLAGVGLR
jgi:hypothetical protein